MFYSPDIASPSSTPAPVRLEDYTPPAWLISTVHLDVDIGVETTCVTATLACERNPAVAGSYPLVLDGEELQTLTVRVDGQDWPYAETASRLTLENLPEQGMGLALFRNAASFLRDVAA